MNCDRYEDQIHLYVDHRLDKRETEDLLSHMETCDHCREMYQEMSALKDLLGGMQMKELPEGFKEELHVKLVEASEEKKASWTQKIKERLWNGPKMKMAVSFGGVAIAAVLVIGNTGLLSGISPMDTYDASYDMAYEMAEEASEEPKVMMAEPQMTKMEVGARNGDVAVTFDEAITDAAAEETSNYALEAVPKNNQLFGASQVETEQSAQSSDTGVNDFKGRLIIKTANISMNVEDYDANSSEIYRMVEEMGGYISDSSSYYYIYDQYDSAANKKSGYMTLRIPYQYFDQFTGQLEGFGEITNHSSNANDITKQYRDTSAEVKNLEVREAKLREIMGRAEEIKDIIEVERELSRVRSEINQYQSILTNWEDLVTLSTVTLNMTEVEDLKIVVKPVDKDVWTKAKEEFIYTINRIVDAFERFFIWLVAMSPIVLPVGLVGIVVLRKLYKRWK
jgi:anti-sigma factor RsiW